MGVATPDSHIRDGHLASTLGGIDPDGDLEGPLARRYAPLVDESHGLLHLLDDVVVDGGDLETVMPAVAQPGSKPPRRDGQGRVIVGGGDRRS